MPGVRQRRGQVETGILCVGAVPRWPGPADPDEHDRRPQGKGSDLDQGECPACEASTMGRRVGWRRKQVGQHAAKAVLFPPVRQVRPGPGLAGRPEPRTGHGWNLPLAFSRACSARSVRDVVVAAYAIFCRRVMSALARAAPVRVPQRDSVHSRPFPRESPASRAPERLRQPPVGVAALTAKLAHSFTFSPRYPPPISVTY